MTDELAGFARFLRQEPPSFEAVRAVRGRDFAGLDQAGRAAVRYVDTAYGHLMRLCKEFYGSKESSGDGFFPYGVPGHHDTDSTVGSEILRNASLIPVPPSSDIASAADLLTYALMYSERGVLVLPDGIEDSFISYSGSGMALASMSTEPVLRAVYYNRQYHDVVARGHCLFLPRRASYWHETTSDHSTTTAAAPLMQDPHRLRYLPMNSGHSAAGLPGYGTVAVLGEFVLPYFPQASPAEIARIKDTESDSFVLFNSYLRTRLAALPDAQTAKDVEEVRAEIAAGAARLRMEAKKVARSRLMRNAEIGAFDLSITAATVTTMVGSGALGTIAGLLGSASLLRLFGAYSEVYEKDLDMRSNTFFIPYLLDTSTDDR